MTVVYVFKKEKKKMEVLKRIINIRGGYGHGGRKQVMLPKRAYSQYVEM